MAIRSYGLLEQFAGYVTTMSSIAGKTAGELERALGLGSPSLASGFYVYALAESVGMDDFEWKDRTAYSDGWHFDPIIGEFVQRRDELRAHWGKVNQYDEAKTDAKLADLMRQQVVRLNVRLGPERIVKVISRQEVLSFPDSPFRTVPQWKLRTWKSFTRIADVQAGDRAPRM